MTQVSIHPYKPEWRELFSEETTRLDPALKSYTPQIDHIGSTSVPGLAAKNIIDILIQLQSPPLPSELDKILEPLGYRRKTVFDLEDYLYYVHGDRLQGFHLHILPTGHERAQVHLHFRDILSHNKAAREEYTQTKLALSQQYAHDRAAYRQEKRYCIQRILEMHGDLPAELIDQAQNAYQEKRGPCQS